MDMAASSRGFDQIQLTSTAGATFRAARIDGENIPATIEVVDQGFKILLDAPVRRSATVAIDLESTIYVNQTRFDAFLFNSALSTTVRQQVDQGDAENTVATNRTFVALPTNSQLLSSFSLSTRVLTPNGDGVFDQLQILNFSSTQLAFTLLIFIWSGFVRSGLGFGGAALHYR